MPPLEVSTLSFECEREWSALGTRHFSPASAHVIWEGLRWRSKDSKDVALLHEQVPKLIDFYNKILLTPPCTAGRNHSLVTLVAPTVPTGNGSGALENHARVELGLWVREVKSLWRLGAK